MGIFRGGSVVILCFLLLISFILVDSFLILGLSLRYNNVESGISLIVQNISSSNSILPPEITGNFNITKASLDVASKIATYCQNVTEYNFTYQGYNLTIPCNENFTANPQQIINKSMNDLTYQIYYANYNCGFFDCFSNTKFPFFLVSEKAMNYWMNKFYIMLGISLILILLLFLFLKQKLNTIIITGALLTITAFPILKLKDLVDFFAGNYSSLINLFLSSTGTVFTLSLIIGIFLIALGIALRIMMRNKVKKKLSVDDVKNIVKKEVADENVKINQKKITKKVSSKKK